MRKILIVLFFIIFTFIDDVLAKEIIVNNIKYDDSIDFEGDGYRFRSDNKILYLNGYNGGSIKYDSLLEIRINKVNVINGDGKNGIDAKEVVLQADGILNIYKSDIGINVEKITVKGPNLYITECKTGMFLTGDELYSYHNEIVVEDCEIGIYSPSLITLIHSNMNVINCEYGIYNDSVKMIFLNQSNLYISSKKYCLYNIEFDDITLSRIVLKSENYCLNREYNYKNATVKGYVSDDDLNYFVNDDYHNYSFIKIGHKDYIEDLLINDKDLIVDIDKSFLSNKNNTNQDENNDEFNKDEQQDKTDNNLDVITNGEYTDNEYSKIEVINPQTIDNIHLFIILTFSSILIIILTLFVRRENE